jgi:hypothetical protein
MVGSVTRRRARLALGLTIAISTAAAATGAANKVTALSRLEPGLWQLRDLDAPKAAQQSVCVADPILLMQLRHRTAPCTRLVIAEGEREAIVHYTCPASGYGQTALRVETPRLAQIDTQGIIENRPFAYRAEARRVGPCENTPRR